MLHLTAFDAEDLSAISAQMQDAVLRFGDSKFMAKQRVFALMANRFAWDSLPEKQRRRSGLRFNYVLSARRMGPKAIVQDTILSLLAITFVAAPSKGDPAGVITLEFSGGHRMALEVECVDVQLDDLGPAWGSEHEPHHDV